VPVEGPPPTAQISLRESEGERRLGDLEDDGSRAGGIGGRGCRGLGRRNWRTFGSRVGAWRRLGNGTLDLVLVGVPRAVTGPLLPTGLVEGSPEDHRHSSMLEEDSPEATTMPPTNGGGGTPQSHGQDVITTELRTEAWISR
jgi:hypothetical protein